MKKKCTACKKRNRIFSDDSWPTLCRHCADLLPSLFKAAFPFSTPGKPEVKPDRAEIRRIVGLMR